MKKRLQFLLGLVLFMIMSVNYVICNVKAEESEFMNSYIEEIDLDKRLYEDNVAYHIELIDNTGEVCANVTIIISYEYADGAWVSMDWIYLNVECCDGYSAIIDENAPIYQDYGVRYYTISNSGGLNIKYAIKAYADCYGETSVDYEIIDRYYS